MTKVQTLLNIPRIKFDDVKFDYAYVKEGSTITIWLDNIYNGDVYSVNSVSDLSVVKVNNNQFTVTGDILGFNRFYVTVTNLVTAQKVDSNHLLVIVDEVLPNLDFSNSNNSQYLAI